jgi:hypothetical protein
LIEKWKLSIENFSSVGLVLFGICNLGFWIFEGFTFIYSSRVYLKRELSQPCMRQTAAPSNWYGDWPLAGIFHNGNISPFVPYP